MYSNFYGFTKPPFQPTPDPACYYDGLSYRRALSCLSDGLAQGGGFLVVTSDPGAGKTTLVAHFLDTLEPDQITVAQIVSGQLPHGDLQGGHTTLAIARAFGLATSPIPGLAPETRNSFLLDATLCFLRDEVRAGRRCLLVVDDAQALPVAALETLRLLSDFKLGDHPLLQVLLIGRPEFRTRLQSHPDLEQLRQRVVASHHLDPLESGEVESYIDHRLQCAGWNGKPGFAPELYAELHAATGGVPRRINQIVDQLLLLAAAGQKDQIDAAMFSAVLAELTDHDRTQDTRLEVALARCEGQIADLQNAVAAIVATRDGHRQTANSCQDDAALQERLGGLESRAIEQERTIRHTLTMLIEWIERDETHIRAV
jgi:general secretion pathway protein A